MILARYVRGKFKTSKELMKFPLKSRTLIKVFHLTKTVNRKAREMATLLCVVLDENMPSRADQPQLSRNCGDSNLMQIDKSTNLRVWSTGKVKYRSFSLQEKF